MPVVILQLPKTSRKPDSRPGQCPYCGSHILQGWGRVTKSIKGRTDVLAIIYRYRCADCTKTFRHYPVGIGRSSHTRSIRKLAALLFFLGLSFRNIEEIFQDFEIDLSYSAVWREVQKIYNQLNSKKIIRNLRKFTIDNDYIHNLSLKKGVVVALDLGSENYQVLGRLNEHNPSSVIFWLTPLVKDADIDTIQVDTGEFDRMQCPP